MRNYILRTRSDWAAGGEMRDYGIAAVALQLDDAVLDPSPPVPRARRSSDATCARSLGDRP